MVVKEFCILVCISVSVCAQMRTPTLSRTGSATSQISLSAALSDYGRAMPRSGSLSSRGESLFRSSTSSLTSAANKEMLLRMGEQHNSALNGIQAHSSANMAQPSQPNVQNVQTRAGAPPLSLRQVLYRYIPHSHSSFV